MFFRRKKTTFDFMKMQYFSYITFNLRLNLYHKRKDGTHFAVDHLIESDKMRNKNSQNRKNRNLQLLQV